MTIIYLTLGFGLITVGLGALLLAAAFWTRHDGRTLHAFGAFVTVYGTGLLARSTLLTPLLGISSGVSEFIGWLVDYWAPIPELLYTEQLRGSGWRSSVRRLLQKLGKHKGGLSQCLHVNMLADVDLHVLKRILEAGVRETKKTWPVSAT